jgi:hypothetical protein
LGLNDFNEMFMPMDEGARRLIGCRPFLQLGSERKRVFCLKTQLLFNRVLKLLIENETKAESIRYKLKRSAVEITTAFNRYDSDSSGKITKSELMQLLNSLGLDIQETDLHLILRRFDKDRDGEISLKEFLREMVPRIEN